MTDQPVASDKRGHEAAERAPRDPAAQQRHHPALGQRPLRQQLVQRIRRIEQVKRNPDAFLGDYRDADSGCDCLDLAFDHAVIMALVARSAILLRNLQHTLGTFIGAQARCIATPPEPN